MATKKGNAGFYIRVDDVRGFAPVPIEQFIEGKVVQDALGRGWLLDSDAREVLERAKAEDQREMELRNQHAIWLQDRTARRGELLEKVRLKVLGGAQHNASNQGLVREAQQAALAAFDQDEPEADFYTWRERSSMSGAR